MELREKLQQLRAAEGERRGLGRTMTQTEVAAAMQRELGRAVSQAYLSQLEAGKRVHLSNTSREVLSRFFGVHPGYLVSDPQHEPTARAGLGAPRAGQSHPDAAHAPHGIPGWSLIPTNLGMPAPRRLDIPGDLAFGERLTSIISRLRDHPEAERVLVLMEHAIHLPSTHLETLSQHAGRLRRKYTP